MAANHDLAFGGPSRVAFACRDLALMSGASTIVVAREDLSLPGADRPSDLTGQSPERNELRFFELIRDHRPDVVVLDLAETVGRGIEVIRKIRERSGVPVLVVCRQSDPRASDYRLAGAAECISAPVDIGQLNATIHRIIQLTRAAPPDPFRPKAASPGAYVFGDLTLRPDQNALGGPNGVAVQLTTAENDLLRHLLDHGRTVHSRAEIAGKIYGRHQPTSHRAVDTVVNRLRKKLFAVGGPAAQRLIKTEFRRGYVLIADVAVIPHPQRIDRRAG